MLCNLSLFVCRGWRLQHMGFLRLRTVLHAVRPFPGWHQLSAPGHLQPAGHARWTARSGHLLAQLPQGSCPTCHAYRSVGYRSRPVVVFFLGGGGVAGGVIVHWLTHQRSYSFIATLSIVYQHLPSNSARIGYTTERALFISAQLSTDAVSAPLKGLGIDKTVAATIVSNHTCKHVPPPWVPKKEEFHLDSNYFGLICAGVSNLGSYKRSTWYHFICQLQT